MNVQLNGKASPANPQGKFPCKSNKRRSKPQLAATNESIRHLMKTEKVFLELTKITPAPEGVCENNFFAEVFKSSMCNVDDVPIVVIDVEQLRKIVMSKLNVKGLLRKDGKIDVDYESVTMTLKVNDIFLKGPAQEEYILDTDHADYEFTLGTDLKDNCVLADGVCDTQKIEFEIEEELWLANAKSSIAVEDIKNELLKMPKGYLLSQKMIVKLAGKVFTVRITNIEPAAPVSNYTAYNVFKTTTPFSVTTGYQSRISLVDTNTAYDLASLKIGVDKRFCDYCKTEFTCKGCKFPLITIHEKDLKNAVLRKLGLHAFKHELINVDCRDVDDVRQYPLLKIQQMEFLGKVPDYVYGLNGKILPETKISFVSKNPKITIVTPPSQIIPPIENLSNFVGGISVQLSEIKRKLMYAQGPLQAEYLKRGQKTIRGILLYGPPGTGKTTLARNIGKMLGCENERFILINSADLITMWLGETEEKIAALFANAEKSQERDGDNSPKYIVVLDEADAVAGRRGEAGKHTHQNGVVNLLLGKLDGVKPLKNLLLILITNRKENLDVALLRSGRVSMHLELGFSDVKGRKEIFGIHMKTIQPDLLKNIDVDELVNLTSGFSGADIEAVVADAGSYSLERLDKLDRSKLSEEEVAKHPVAMVTMEDFRKAIRSSSILNKNIMSEELRRFYGH